VLDVLAYCSEVNVWTPGVRYAAELAATFGATLTGVHVSPPWPMHEPAGAPPSLMAELVAHAQEEVGVAMHAGVRFGDWARGLGVTSTRWHVALGDPADVLGVAANWSDLVLSGRDSGTRWTIDGRGNYWSRYRGFDFDGDGIGDAPHPLVGAFERIEGANPAARIFLQSPAAAGLELAARLSGRAADDAVDDRPIVRQPRPAASGSSRPTAGIAGAALLLGLGCVLWNQGRHAAPSAAGHHLDAREADPCSR